MSYRTFLANQHTNPSDPAYDPPPEPEYFLRDKPFGKCTWCGSELLSVRMQGELEPQVWCPNPRCDDYLGEDTETENRIRYAAERLEDAMGRQP